MLNSCLTATVKSPCETPQFSGLSPVSQFFTKSGNRWLFLLVQLTNNIISPHSHGQEVPGRTARPPTHLSFLSSTSVPAELGELLGWSPQPWSFLV